MHLMYNILGQVCTKNNKIVMHSCEYLINFPFRWDTIRYTGEQGMDTVFPTCTEG